MLFGRNCSKYKDQLMAVKTNKEYQAVLTEIATCEKEIAGKEDQILETMIFADELSSQEAAASSELTEKEQVIQAKRKELEAFIADFTSQVAGLETQRQACATLSPRNCLSSTNGSRPPGTASLSPRLRISRVKHAMSD